MRVCVFDQVVVARAQEALDELLAVHAAAWALRALRWHHAVVVVGIVFIVTSGGISSGRIRISCISSGSSGSGIGSGGGIGSSGGVAQRSRERCRRRRCFRRAA